MQSAPVAAKLSFMLALLALLAATYAHPEQLVETDWVADHGADANVRVVDMRQSGVDGGHVPGAVYLSPVAIRDAKAPPTFLPAPAAFEQLMAKPGISDATRVTTSARGRSGAIEMISPLGRSDEQLVNW
jgi:3-mercaptopyruvate sulfurtransferase SseA